MNRNYDELRRDLLTEHLSFSEVIERVGAAIKVTEDLYYAAIYRGAMRVFRAQEVADATQHKLEVMYRTYSMLSDEDLVHRLSTQTIVRAIPDMISTATAIAGDKGDNATALAIMWQGSPEVETPGTNTADNATVISTMMLPDNLVSTTIQANTEQESPSEVDAFNDDEIEKAIAEIRGAIEKSSQIIK